MTTRTRYFVILSLLITFVGGGTGLVSYYVGLPAGALAGPGPAGPDELRFVPSDVAVVGYANVRELMTSGLRQRMHQAMPEHDNAQKEFQESTGINIETDVDHVVACLKPESTTGDGMS